MSVLTALLIVAIAPDAPNPGSAPVGAEVFSCGFGPAWDANFDAWPDGWSRRRGPGFPKYVDIGLAEEPSASAGRALRIDLDGGGAVAYSPAIRVRPDFDYTLEARVRTRGLVHDRAYLTLVVIDAARHRLAAFRSTEVRHAPEWQTLRLGPVRPADPKTYYAIVGLHLEPERRREDLTGAAWFDDVRLCRSPRLEIEAGRKPLVFAAGEPVTIACRASGLTENRAIVSLRLEDALGRVLARDEHPLTLEPAGDAAAATPNRADAADETFFAGNLRWDPPLPGPGFYRVRAAADAGSAEGLCVETTLAVVRPERPAAASEFGWSLGDVPETLAPGELAALLAESGARRVKYPLWPGAATSEAQWEDLKELADGLDQHGVEIVGVLSRPPEEVRNHFDPPEPMPAARVFSAEPEVWLPSLEGVMAKLGTRVRKWQLGSDGDTSFAGCPAPAEMIRRVNAQLAQRGYHVELGVAWPDADPPPCEFLVQPTATLPRRAGPAVDGCWVTIQPLDADAAPLESRAADLVRKMVAAKLHGAGGIFLADPLVPGRGMLGAEGSPGELLLPWRTAAVLLGGGRYMGSIQLPGGSENHVFSHGGRTVMVLSAERPSREVVYVGPEVRRVDLWGRELSPPRREHRHEIEVGPVPVFVTGVDEPLVRWRQGVSLADGRVPSIFGRRHDNRLDFTNALDRPVEGRLTLVGPKGWTIEPGEAAFRLEPGERRDVPFSIGLPYYATVGRHWLRVDFEIDADPPVRFSVYRAVEVGPADLQLDGVARFDSRSELEVRQRLVNETGRPVSFRGYLYAAGRRRISAPVLHQGEGTSFHIYHVPDGRELAGRAVWLRLEEIDGPRVLNCRVLVPRANEGRAISFSG